MTMACTPSPSRYQQGAFSSNGNTLNSYVTNTMQFPRRKTRYNLGSLDPKKINKLVESGNRFMATYHNNRNNGCVTWSVPDLKDDKKISRIARTRNHNSIRGKNKKSTSRANHATRLVNISSIGSYKAKEPSNDAHEFAVLRYLENLDYLSEDIGMPQRPSNEAMELFAFVNNISFPKKYMSRSYRSQFIYSVINGMDPKKFTPNPKEHLTIMSVCRRQSSKKSGKWHFVEKNCSPFLVVVKALFHMGFFEDNDQTWEAIKEFLDLNGLLCDQPIGSYDQVSNDYKKRIIYDIYRLFMGKRHLFKRNVKNPNPENVRSVVILKFIVGGK